MQPQVSSEMPTLDESSTELDSSNSETTAGEAWHDDWLAPEWLELPESKANYARRLQAAERLREVLSCVPFYAKAAETARLRGDEMAYWLCLQGSEATLRRPQPAVQPVQAGATRMPPISGAS